MIRAATDQPLIRLSGVDKRYRTWASPQKMLKAMLLQHAVDHVRMPRSMRDAAAGFIRGSYAEHMAVTGLDLVINDGERVGIIGRNGSGKSTLLSIVAGIVRPTRGTVERRGRIGALLELGSGFNTEFTGRENIYMNAAIHGLSRADIESRFDRIVEFAEIGAFLDAPVKTYSSGMVVRLAFAVLAHTDPDVLLIDEALAVGDAYFVQKCMRWMKSFSENHTILLVTHDLSAIAQFCDRTLWMEKGRIAFDGAPREATERYLASIYNQVEIAGSRTKAAESGAEAGAPQSAFDIFVGDFDGESRWFGERKASIVDVLFSSDRTARARWLRSGDMAYCRITACAHERIAAPIIGFGVKNRRGQELFHANTELSRTAGAPALPLTIEAGEQVAAEFSFIMPHLPAGEYFFFAALATGTHDRHTQQHWVHEAMRLKSVPDRQHLGLVGIPMLKVTMEKAPPAGADGPSFPPAAPADQVR